MENDISQLKNRVTSLENKDSDDADSRSELIKKECKDLFDTENERRNRLTL